MSNADYSYGAHFGEYGGIGPYGYGSQPGEYGIDANHGIVRLLQSLEYGQTGGPTAIPPHPQLGRAVTWRSPRPRRRRRRLRILVTALLLAVGVLLAAPAPPHHAMTLDHQRQPVGAHSR